MQLAVFAKWLASFSALQRAEIAEIAYGFTVEEVLESFSALQRAEIAEIPRITKTPR